MFIVSTTGTVAQVTISDLPTPLILNHPVINQDLELSFTVQDLAQSIELQAAIDNGWIISKDAQGVVTSDISSAGTIAENLEEEIIELIEQHSTGGSGGLPYFEYASHETYDENTSTSFDTTLTLNATIPAAGQYKLTWSYIWSHDHTSSSFHSEILDGSTVLLEHVQEPKDSGGTGNGGTDQRIPALGIKILTLPAGARTFSIRFKSSQNNKKAGIHMATMTIERVL